MILCFSGTGNSLAVARALARMTGDPLTDMAKGVADRAAWRAALHASPRVGFVCPVHAWGAPRVVERFVRDAARGGGWEAARGKYVYLVLTCGDDTGMADRRFRRLLAETGLPLDAAFSVMMPNTYVGLPGFDVDDKPLEEKKLSASVSRVARIGEAVLASRRSLADVHRGAFPRLKTYVLRPLFHLLFTGDRRFSADPACNGCGLCQRHCPVGNIRMARLPQDAERREAGKGPRRPRWEGNCADCLRCYHICPGHRIACGAHSCKAGQYLHKDLLEKA